MSDRGLPTVDGAPACPFVAFSDDRDARSTSPDHRHRCFAESPPAPRAAAHQEAYCLSSAFPVCPTFQDWARREAAHAQEVQRTADAATSARAAEAAAAGVAVAASSDVDDGPAPSGAASPDRPDGPNEWTEPPASDEPVQRNPRRDWAAPPPWATGVAATSSARAPESSPPDFLASRSVEGAGLAGSAADRLAGGPAPTTVGSGGSARPGAPAVVAVGATASRATAEPDDDLAELVGGRATPPRSPQRSAPPPATPAKRPAVSSTRSRDMIKGPAWEGSRRYEAYPTIKTRAGLPGLPRIAVLAGALGVAALALFFLPALLGVGGGGGGSTSSSSPSPSAAVASGSPSPSVAAEPTPQVYVIKTGDTLSKVAKKFGITLDALLAANKETIKDPDKISVGDEIIIPPPPSDDLTDPSASPE